MKTIALLVALAAAELGFGWFRQNQITELRRTNETLRQSSAELSKYKMEHQQANKQEIEANELAQLRAEWAELMKLRSEIGRLREASRLELPQVQAQLAHLETAIAQENQRATNQVEERAALLHSSLARDCLDYALLNPMLVVVRTNGGLFPRSFAEFEQMLQALPEGEGGWVRQQMFQTNQISETEIIGRTFSVSARDFEFVSHPAPLTTNGPAKIVLREAAARALPGGKQARWYGFTDGRVEEVQLDHPDFSAWERKAMQ